MKNFFPPKILNLIDWYIRGIQCNNQKKIRSFRGSTSSAKCLFFISPGDFNSIEEFGLISDKTAFIGNLLQDNGYECAYFLREILSTKSKLPKRVPTWPFGVITQRLHIRRYFLIIFSRYLWKPKEMHWAKILGHKPRTLFGEFLLSCLYGALRELKPNVVFTIGASQDILEICQELEIKVFEVMHGVFNEAEISSEFMSPLNLKPDLYLTWHSSYSNLLTKHGINAFTLGHPNLKFSKPLHRKINALPTYLVTLEHGISNSEDDFGVLEKELSKFVKCLSSREVNVVFRVHPVIASDRRLFLKVKKWLQSNYEKCSIESPLEVSLYESLSKVDVQISYRSSTFFEAALLGVPTVLIEDITLRHIPDELIAAEYVHQVKTITDMEGIIANPLKPLDFTMRKEELLHLMKIQLNH